MGWTHDYRVAGDRSNIRQRLTAFGAARRLSPHHESPELGIPRILGRRARWFGARLRHPRD